MNEPDNKLPNLQETNHDLLTAGMLSTFAWGMIIVIPLFYSFVALLLPENLVRWLSVAIVLVAIASMCLVLTRAGRLQLAGIVLLSGIWLVITSSAVTAGGVRSPAVASYLVFIFAAGLFLGNRVGISFAALSSFAVLVMALMESNGSLPANSVRHTPYTLWLAYTMFSVLVLIAQYLSSKAISDTLHRLKEELIMRQKTEILLRESDERLAHFYQATFEGIAITLDGKIIEVNEQMAKMLGIETEEIVGGRVVDYVAPGYRAFVAERCESGSEEAYEHLALRKDGTPFPVEARGRTIPLHGKSARATIIRDMTERIESEQRLTAAQELYQELFNNTLTGVFIVTPDGMLKTCNPAYLRIFRFPSMAEAQKGNMTQLFVDPKTRENILRQLQSKRTIENIEVEMVRHDGSMANIVACLVGKFDERGKLAEVQGHIFDDTKRHELEQQFMQSQKLEELGTLAGGIAHDFNNVLSIILGHASLLEQTKDRPAEFSHSIDATLKATRRGISLVKQLLTFARKDQFTFEPMQVNDTVEEIKKLLEATFPKTITISTSLQQDIPAIIADATQIHQVLLNLCVNARDAMPRGGTLLISTKLVPVEDLSTKFLKASARRYARVAVKDSGTGIDDATLKKIFEPFFTTKPPGQGTGLGLSLVFSIVEHHQGFIDVQSVTGQGTSFIVYLPVPDQSPELDKQVHIEFEDSPGGTETVLLIEDELMLQELAKAVLTSKGYSVLVAEDGRTGIETYLNNKDSIAVVVADMGLPEISGEDVIKKIREINPRAKAILASGSIDSALKARMAQTGAKRWIQKPYGPEELLTVVRQVIDSPV
jgi:PAS domain S-box-containing protein